MRVRSLLALLVLLVFIQGCRFSPASPSHQFALDKSINPEGYMQQWRFVDVSEDEVAKLLVVGEYKNNYQPFLIKNQNTDIHSQLNIIHPLMSFKVLYNEYDDSNWLFYSFNDGNRVYLQAARYVWEKKLKRANYHFQPIDRTDSFDFGPNYQWVGSMTPVMIKDIDGDDEIELVCLGASAYRANPRGIFVYDLMSGRLKWQLDTAANISSLIYEDFDLDGKKDLIASTVALKNNQRIINGTSDHSPSIFACNAKGELIFVEKCFDGFGQVLLESVDLDNDGTNDIIRIDHTWGTDNHKNSVSIIKPTGGKFVTERRYEFETPITREFRPLITNLDESNEKYIFISNKLNGLIILDKELQKLEHDLDMSVRRIESIKDIDNDNKKEILLLGGDNEFIILNSALKVEAKIDNPFPNDEKTKADIIRNGKEKPKRIAIACHTGINYYDYKLLPWYQLLRQWVESVLPVLFGLMLIILFFMGIRIAKLRKREAIFLSQTQLGVMIVSKRRIIKMNPAMLSLLNDSQVNEKIDLEWISMHHSSLYKEIKAFCHSVAASTTKNVYSNHDCGHESQVFMHRLCYLPCRVLIMLSAQAEGRERSAEKVQWAEISRRLSHHVRRHISNILLALNILENNPDPAEQTAKREIIRDEVDRIKIFTQAFQRFSEMGEYQLKVIDIVPWLENSISRFHIPPHIEVIKDWSLASLPALIEPIRFEEVMVNLHQRNRIDA
jgi:hypothetical protein